MSHFTEDASLRSQIGNKINEMESQPSKLARRDKEIELTNLQKQMTDMLERHAVESSALEREWYAAFSRLKERREDALSKLKKRQEKEIKAQQLESMVIQQLEDLARLKHLDFGNKEGWLWSKKKDELPSCHTDFPESLPGSLNWQVFQTTPSAETAPDTVSRPGFRLNRSYLAALSHPNRLMSSQNTCQMLSLQGNPCVM